MDIILAIETSTAHGTVALYEVGKPLEVIEFSSDRSHNAVIFEPLQRLLKAGLPDLIVVGTGPGSYSGIRVGIAAGLGISLAHGVPLIGLSSVTALGEAYALERYAITGNARRGSWWYAEVTGGGLSLPPIVEDEPSIAARTSQWPGLLFTLDTSSPPFCTAHPVRPRADVLASRAGKIPESALTRLAAIETEPLYLRAPFITVSKKQSLASPGPAVPPVAHGL